MGGKPDSQRCGERSGAVRWLVMDRSGRQDKAALLQSRRPRLKLYRNQQWKPYHRPPVATHFNFAREALEAGKHVLIEKPFTTSVREAEILVEMAERKRLTLMVDHTFVYTGAVRKIKEIVQSGELGDLLYFDSTRINLGIFQHDINVVWDLAPHDLSIMDFIIDRQPKH